MNTCGQLLPTSVLSCSPWFDNLSPRHQDSKKEFEPQRERRTQSLEVLPTKLHELLLY